MVDTGQSLAVSRAYKGGIGMTINGTGCYVSADGHVVEPADLWITRMDRRFRDRAPRVESRPDAEHYITDGLSTFPVGLEGATMEDKIAGEITAVVGHRHGEARPGAWDPQARLVDQDMDHWWTDHHREGPKLDEAPSTYFKRQFWATFADERAGILTRELLGVDRLMWGSDYPHTEGTFRHSQEQIMRDFMGVPEPEVYQMVVGNAASLYGLDV